MLTIFRGLFIALVLFPSFGAFASSPESERGLNQNLLWNQKKQEAPFVRRGVSTSSFAGPLIYQSGDLSFPLLQALVFDPAANCYSLVVQRGTDGLELVNLWRARAGFYSSGNGPYLELANLESLKTITTLNGTRFIFAEVGDGAWHCVSIHDLQGNYLMIDYRPNGLVARLRDSFGRTATPVYSNQRLVALTQVWSTPAGEQIKTVSVAAD